MKREELEVVGIVLMFLILIFGVVTIMAGCHLLCEKELTKRQYIAGTNVIEKYIK